MTPEEMYEKLKKLYLYVKEKGGHPSYRDEKFRGQYLKTKPKNDYQLTIRVTAGNFRFPWCMNYVCIHNLKIGFFEYFYVRKDYHYYDYYHIEKDNLIKKEYSHVNLVSEAYKIFIREEDEKERSKERNMQ